MRALTLPVGDYPREPVKMVFKFQKSVRGASWSLLQSVGDGILPNEVLFERQGNSLRSGPDNNQ